MALLSNGLNGNPRFSLFFRINNQKVIYVNKREKYIGLPFSRSFRSEWLSSMIYMAEKDIVTAILRYLKSVPDCFAWKEHGGMYGTAGIPDIIACIGGRFFAFEVKMPSGKLTRLQQVTIEKICSAGGLAYKVTSLIEVKNILENMEDSPND